MATKKTTGTPAKKAVPTATKAAAKTIPQTGSKTSAKAPSKTPSKDSVAPETPSHTAGGKSEPTHAEISHRAHQYWKERGHSHGSHEEDWTRAERELKSR